jgi:hypothetical protein
MYICKSYRVSHTTLYVFDCTYTKLVVHIPGQQDKILWTRILQMSFPSNVVQPSNLVLGETFQRGIRLRTDYTTSMRVLYLISWQHCSVNRQWPGTSPDSSMCELRVVGRLTLDCSELHHV